MMFAGILLKRDGSAPRRLTTVQGLSALAGGLLCALFAVAPAFAECQEDIQKFMKRRDSVIGELNGMSKGGKKQLDPIAACPKFRSLSSILGEAVAYLEKNKEWCGLPPDLIEGAKKQRTQFATTAVKACNVAAQIQKMKAMAAKQQAEGMTSGPQAQRLPTGPL